MRRQGDRPRVLALVEPENTATLLALAHEFDFDMTLPFLPRSASAPTGTGGIGGQRLYYELGDRFDTLYGDELIDAWAAALDSSQTYDAIILNCYVPNVGWALLPESLQSNILARVAAGTGLVVIRRGEPVGPTSATADLDALLPLGVVNESDYQGFCQPIDDRTIRGLPWEILPASGRIFKYSARSNAEVLLKINYGSEQLPLLARSTAAGGRVLDLAWAGGRFLIPPDSYRDRQDGTTGMDLSRYDLALIARIICDAAGREPSVAISNVALDGDSATVDLESTATTSNTFDLSWVARDRFGLILGQDVQSLDPITGANTISFDIPSGTWTLDLVTQPMDGGEPGWGAGGRPLDFTVALNPNATAFDPDAAPQITTAVIEASGEYVLELLDGRGRILERVNLTVGGSLALDISRVETPYAEVRVHALDASRQLVGQAFLPLRIRRRAGADRWTIHFWNTAMVLPNALMARHLAAQASLGISGYFSLPASVSASDDTIAAADRLGIPYVVQSSGWLHAAYGTPSSGSGYPFTLTDGEEIATGRAGDTNLAASLADANVLYYRLADDEPDPPDTDVSFDDQALARFHAWLGETYGYADSVFRSEWGMSSTATTARATPLSYSDAIAAFATALATSGATPTYAPWVDHRRFMIDIFSRLPAAARSALRRGDPRALTGTSGDNRMGMWTGRDWWARGHAIDVVGRYATSTAVELDALGGRSIVWTGYDDPDPIIRYRVWTALGLGEHGLALFNENTLVNPDLSLPEVGRDLAAALLPVRRGVGGLFAASRPADDGVYVLTSPDSSAVLAIHGYERLGSWVSGSPPSQPDLGGDAREGVHDLLSAMGIGWSALAPADVEEGALERNGARVLILPMCAALSDAACTAIRRWVALGGALIADLLPGVFTAHGRMRGASITTAGAMQSSINPLDNMFGVMPGARPPITSKVVTFSAGGQFTARCVDSATTSMPTITTVTHSGTAPANISLWFRNPYEQGQTAYLGCSVFADYGAASRADRLAIERAFAALLQDLGVAPRAQIVDAGGARVELCQFHIRSSGASDLIVLLRNFLGVYDPVAEEADGELYFSTEAHTYDLDNGAYLGYGDRLPLHVSAYAFRAFARLPYRVRGVNVQAADAPRLGDSIAVTATLQVDEGASPQRHRFRLDVLAGDAPLHYLAQEVTAECGAAGFSVPSALNDPPGEWTIVVTDVNTGVQGRVRVDMGPRAAQPFPQPAPLQIGALED